MAVAVAGSVLGLRRLRWLGRPCHPWRQADAVEHRPSASGPVGFGTNDLLRGGDFQNAITLTPRPEWSAARRAAHGSSPSSPARISCPKARCILTVTEFASDAAADARVSIRRKASTPATRRRYRPWRPSACRAFLASDDVVLSVKDNKLLRVDATQLPKTVGPLHRSRRDLSYLVASAILRCWSGD